MRIGVCAEMDALPYITQAGADYIECRVTEINGKTDAELAAFKQKLAASGIKCEALAVLFPGAQLPLCGEAADTERIDKYLRDTFKRLGEYLSPSVVVFGSGAARRCPDSFDASRAMEQLIQAARLAADAAAPYNITVAIEPLNRKETNMINTLRQAYALVLRTERSNVKIISDIYHMLTDNEAASEIAACARQIVHTHIAAKEGRMLPREKDRAAFAPYFNELKRAGYNGRISIEADGDIKTELAASIEFLKREL